MVHYLLKGHVEATGRVLPDSKGCSAVTLVRLEALQQYLSRFKFRFKEFRTWGLAVRKLQGELRSEHTKDCRRADTLSGIHFLTPPEKPVKQGKPEFRLVSDRFD